MARLDVFLRNTGLVRQRSGARAACDAGRVRINGQPARASHALQPGACVQLDLDDRRLEVEVLALPARPVARADRPSYYRLVSQVAHDPHADLEF